MAQPTTYNRVYNFQNYEAANPTLTKPGQYMDAEYNAVKVTLDQVLANLALIQRDDGDLANGSVGVDQLASGLSLGFTFRGSWVTATNYVAADGVAYSGKLYRATVSHLSSGTNRPDLDSVTWTLLVDLSSGIALADGSVTTIKIADLNVTTAKIADVNITTGKIADANVTLAKLETAARHHYPPQGRLTLQTAVPVMTTTQSAKTTIYYTPYNGRYVPIYDGTNMVPTAFTELSVLTTDTTKSPAAIGASKVNDWFIWSDSGTLRIGHGPDWTNDTTRSAGTALVLVNGLWLNNASITNGPAASRGTYVGTTRSNASSQLDWIFGAVAATGTAGFHGVWNMYNRVSVAGMVRDSTDSWLYSSVTIRAANNSANMRVTCVRGIDEDSMRATYQASATGGAATSGFASVSLDSTTAMVVGQYCGGQAITSSAAPTYDSHPGLGVHFLSATESTNNATNNVTFYGDAGTTNFQTGLSYWLMA